MRPAPVMIPPVLSAHSPGVHCAARVGEVGPVRRRPPSRSDSAGPGQGTTAAHDPWSSSAPIWHSQPHRHARRRGRPDATRSAPGRV